MADRSTITIGKSLAAGMADPAALLPSASAPGAERPPSSHPPPRQPSVRKSPAPAARKGGGFRAREYLLFDAVLLTFEASVYLAAFALPAQALWLLRGTSPLLLAGGIVASFPVAAFVFVSVLILVRRLLLPKKRIPSGRLFRRDPKALRWLLAGLLQGIFWRSPFWRFVNSNCFFRQFFYRGMGARIEGTLLTGAEVKICEPWSFRAGAQVFIADGCVIAGHKIEREIVSLGPVEIGDRVLIGGCSIVFPDVKIGSGAVVGAHSVVTRGTVIPAGETWAGNPAAKVDLFRKEPL